MSLKYRIEISGGGRAEDNNNAAEFDLTTAEAVSTARSITGWLTSASLVTDDKVWEEGDLPMTATITVYMADDVPPEA